MSQSVSGRLDMIRPSAGASEREREGGREGGLCDNHQHCEITIKVMAR